MSRKSNEYILNFHLKVSESLATLKGLEDRNPTYSIYFKYIKVMKVRKKLKAGTKLNDQRKLI